MATSPTSKSAPLSNAAKDDALGADGVYTFTIADLLGNDAGGANHLGTGQFFFGSGTDRAHQSEYMAAHGIVDNGDGTYTLTAGAIDFQYSVQIGNRGTWSTANVDVTAPVPHAGDNLFAENFDHADPVANPLFAVVDLNAESGWTGAAHTELGADGYGGIDATSGGFWFDTQNSPGGVNISHTFTDTTAAVAGTTSVLSFDIGTQSLEYQGQHYETDANASFEFRIDGVTVAHFDATDFATANEMQHFDVNIAGYGIAGDTHTLQLVDTSSVSGYTGFAVDSIRIDDWVI
jgi:hypothetical protein